MKFGIRSMRVRNQIALVFSLVFLTIVVGQMLGSTLIVTHAVGSQANDYILETLKQTSSKMDTLMDSYRMMANAIASNPIVIDVLTRNNQTALEQVAYTLSYEDSRAINREIAQASIAYQGINSIQIVAPNYIISYNFVGDSPFNAGEMTQGETARLQESQGETVLLSIRREPTDKINARAVHVFSAARKIYRFRNHVELAYLFINIQESVIRTVIDDVSIGVTGTLDLFDANGVILSSRSQELIGQQIPEDLFDQSRASQGGWYQIAGDTLTAAYFSDALQWGVVTSLPVSEVAAPLVRIRGQNLLIGLLGVLLASVVSYMLSKQLIKPLEQLVDSMTLIRSNSLDARVEPHGGSEFRQLGQTFNEMADELNGIIKHNIEIETLSKEARLRAIQAQINPHFLYNTLDTIYWKLVMEGKEEIADLVVSLSEMLRYSISGSGERPVTLRRELNNLEHYQQIQNARFPGKIDWIRDVSPDCLGMYMPKMLIQPLVENAVLHGMDANKVLAIRLAARLEKGDMLVVVEDNGKGIPPERLSGLLSAANNEKDQPAGFGLFGVHRQVQLRYGTQYGLSLSSQIDAGTSVELRIPQLDNDKERGDENHAG